jgi:hypothetical protein
MIKNLTEKIWYLGDLYEVIQVFSPHKEEDFIVLNNPNTNTVHEDGKQSSDMFMIDAHNDEFFPNTAEVRKIMNEIREAEENVEKIKRKHSEKLTKAWLEATTPEGNR